MSSKINIVLVNPEIPQNTGNVGRTCLGIGATLHLVGKLGFSLDASALRRAGLDYWTSVDVKRHETWDEFVATVPAEAQTAFFSTKGEQNFWNVKFRFPLYLVFGAESSGLPPDFYSRFKDKLYRIPIESGIRSLNLATAVGVAAFEAVRQSNQSV